MSKVKGLRLNSTLVNIQLQLKLTALGGRRHHHTPANSRNLTKCKKKLDFVIFIFYFINLFIIQKLLFSLAVLA